MLKRHDKNRPLNMDNCITPVSQLKLPMGEATMQRIYRMTYARPVCVMLRYKQDKLPVM